MLERLFDISRMKRATGLLESFFFTPPIAGTVHRRSLAGKGGERRSPAKFVPARGGGEWGTAGMWNC